MSAEGEKKAVLNVTKVRTKLRDDLSWLQRQNGTPEANEEKPWMAEVRACRLNSAFTDTSPVSSPTESAPSPTKANPERSSQSGFIIRGVFTKLDKPASPATTSPSGTAQFTKKPSESYKKIAPHTVRSTSENQEGPLSPEEKEKRTEAASGVLRRSAARQRSYVLSAAKKFESPPEENATPEAKSPSFVAKRVEITEDDEGSKSSASPTSTIIPVASTASMPQPKPRKTYEDSAKTAVDVTVNELTAPKQQEVAEEKKEELVAPEAVEEDFPQVSVTDADPLEDMKPGCTKVFTPLAELAPESVQAVSADTEPVESNAPQKLVLPVLELTPATPESLSPTLIPEVPESLALAASDPEPPESTKTLVLETSATSVPEPSVAEPSAPESVAPSFPQSVAGISSSESKVLFVPEPAFAELTALESSVSSVPESVQEPPASEELAPSVPEPSIAEPSAPEELAPSVLEPSVAEASAPESPVPELSIPVTPAVTILESSTLVSITSEPQVLEFADTASPVTESSDLLPLTPESPPPLFSVIDSLAPVSQAPDLLIPVSAIVESPDSVILESPAPESPGTDSEVSPPADAPVSPVADLLAPQFSTLVSLDQQPLAPVSPPQISVVTETIRDTASELEPKSESSPNIRSNLDTLAALSDSLISFDSGSASVKSSEPKLTEKEASSADVHPTDHIAELEPVPPLSDCVPMTDDLLALSDGPEASVEPVPPSPGRWSQDLLGGINGESSQVKIGSALDILADDVIPIDTDASSLNTQPEETETPAAEETQSPTETVTITTKTVIITDGGEQDNNDPIQTTHETTVITESSSADPFDPRPIGTTSPNRASDLLLSLSDASVNSYSIEEKEPSPPQTNLSSSALASLADDVIPIDTGAVSLSTRRTWARTWDTDTEKSQEAEVEGQDAEQKLVVMFERKSKENDSPWDRWTSPTVYTISTEEEEQQQQQQEEEDESETRNEPEPAMDRYSSDWRTTVQEEQRVLTPEPEAKKGFVFVKEYVNSTEMASLNAADSVNSWSDSAASSTTYTYSSPDTYSSSSGSLSSICTYCGEPVGNDSKISIEHLNINCHTGCFKCNVCNKPMGDLLDSMFLHRGQVNCESCHAKAFD